MTTVWAAGGPGLGDPTPAEAPSRESLLRELEGLRVALEGRTVTAQATGIIAGRLGISTDVAWNVLRRASNTSNVKLRDVARVVVDRHDGVTRPEDDDVARAVAGVLAPAVRGGTPPDRQGHGATAWTCT
jgi:hypothetical protein